MLRKTMIVLAMAASLTGGLTADALARGGGGGGHGGGFGGTHVGGGFGGARVNIGELVRKRLALLANQISHSEPWGPITD
jgi:hypothetical protein